MHSGLCMLLFLSIVLCVFCQVAGAYERHLFNIPVASNKEANLSHTVIKNVFQHFDSNLSKPLSLSMVAITNSSERALIIERLDV